jgi:diguanylate cyclase (GGDEF)-like protein
MLDLIGNMDLGNLHIPLPLAMAVIAAIGYLIGRKNRPNENDIIKRSRLELKRAQMVAMELEKITLTVRKNLSRHRTSVIEFKDRVNRLSELHNDPAWKELCLEADEVLKPTLQLASQIADAYVEIRQQSSNLTGVAEGRADRLTGVANRRGLDDILIAQFALLTRYDTPFTLAIFDIDHFKRVNDEQGHLIGDRILQELAKLLDESVRETDILARYGNDKFALIMPQTDATGAGILCDRLRGKIERQLEVTVSGGVTACTFDDTQETLLARADSALAQAKVAGRNRIYLQNGNLSEAVEQEPLVEVM